MIVANVAFIGAEGATAWFGAGRTISPADRSSCEISLIALRVAHLRDGIQFLLLWVFQTARRLSRSSLICVFLAHRGEVSHAIRALVVAGAAAPSLVTLLALWIEEKTKLL